MRLTCFLSTSLTQAEAEHARAIADAREGEKVTAIATKLREEGAEDAAIREARDAAVRECALPLPLLSLPYRLVSAPPKPLPIRILTFAQPTIVSPYPPAAAPGGCRRSSWTR